MRQTWNARVPYAGVSPVVAAQVLSPRSIAGYSTIVLPAAPPLVPAVFSTVAAPYAPQSVVAKTIHVAPALQAPVQLINSQPGGSVRLRPSADINVQPVGSMRFMQPVVPFVTRFVTPAEPVTRLASDASIPTFLTGSTMSSEGRLSGAGSVKRACSFGSLQTSQHGSQASSDLVGVGGWSAARKPLVDESSLVTSQREWRQPFVDERSLVSSQRESMTAGEAARKFTAPSIEIVVAGEDSAALSPRPRSLSPRSNDEVAADRCNQLFEEAKARHSRKAELQATSPWRERARSLSPTSSRLSIESRSKGRGFECPSVSGTFAQRLASDMQTRSIKQERYQACLDYTFHPKTKQFRGNDGKAPQYRPKMPKAIGIFSG